MMFSEKENSGNGGLGGHASNQSPVVIESPVVYKFYPMTNADRIRSMTGEELAEWLNHMQADAYNRGMLEDWIFGYPNNYDNWLKWLLKEADHD